jgi:putative salt-induced outer membrane protein YdiY
MVWVGHFERFPDSSSVFTIGQKPANNYWANRSNFDRSPNKKSRRRYASGFQNEYKTVYLIQVSFGEIEIHHLVVAFQTSIQFL